MGGRKGRGAGQGCSGAGDEENCNLAVPVY